MPDLTDAEHGEQVGLAAATPGPWERGWDDDRGWVAFVDDRGWHGDDQRAITAPWADGPDRAEADADLIAHAPDDLVRLLARAEAAEARLADVWDEGYQQALSDINWRRPMGTHGISQNPHRPDVPRVYCARCGSPTPAASVWGKTWTCCPPCIKAIYAETAADAAPSNSEPSHLEVPAENSTRLASDPYRRSADA